MLGAALADWLSITSEDMSMYPMAILIKMGLLVIAFAMVFILPNDKALKELSLKLNPVEPEPSEKSESQTKKIPYL